MKSRTRIIAHLLLVSLLLGCGGTATIAPTQASPQLTGVAQALIDLLQKQDQTSFTAEDYESTSLGQIVTFGTPAGYRIKIRYLNFGIALVEALKISRDSELRRRLIEMVQWSRRPEVRAEAIITLASLLDPTHKKYFKEAVLDGKVGIRFAAVEALQLWGQPESIPLLNLAMVRDNSPLMQIYAAHALLALGEESARPIIWKGLDNHSWVIRAMSARYLGDFGFADDYQKMVTYFDRETRNDFAKAEMAIAALKMISKKGEKISYSPSSPGWRQNEEVAYHMGRDNVIELEPLIIVPPQLRIPASLRIAAQINTELLRMIKDRLDVPLDPLQAQDPVLQELNSMVTPSGFALKIRYSQLSYLVVEGVAGTRDPLLRAELQRLVTDATNPLVRANALIALAYSRDENDLYLIQDALSHKNAIVRMGAMEAMDVGRFRAAVPSLLSVANEDPSPALQMYALYMLSKFGNPTGHALLISRLNDQDWPARAMAYWYLGRYGEPEDYSMILARLATESNPFVQSEIALAVLRLAPVESR